MADEPTSEVQVFVPPEQEGGTYSNYLVAWYSAFEFTLDFCATLPPRRADDEALVVIPCRVVSRIKIPVTLIFDMLRTVNGIMTQYEDQFGPIKRVEEDHLP